MTALSIAGQVSIVLGALILLSAGIGVLKFPDAYTRTSAVSTAAGYGVVFVVFGALLLEPTMSNTIKVAVIVPLQLLTSAVASTAIARSAYITGTEPTRLRYDDLGTQSVNDEGHTSCNSTPRRTAGTRPPKLSARARASPAAGVIAARRGRR